MNNLDNVKKSAASISIIFVFIYITSWIAYGIISKALSVENENIFFSFDAFIWVFYCSIILYFTWFLFKKAMKNKNNWNCIMLGMLFFSVSGFIIGFGSPFLLFLLDNSATQFPLLIPFLVMIFVPSGAFVGFLIGLFYYMIRNRSERE